MTASLPSFENEDDEVRYYLETLRDGTAEQKTAARDALARIFAARRHPNKPRGWLRLTGIRGLRIGVPRFGPSGTLVVRGVWAVLALTGVLALLAVGVLFSRRGERPADASDRPAVVVEPSATPTLGPGAPIATSFVILQGTPAPLPPTPVPPPPTVSTPRPTLALGALPTVALGPVSGLAPTGLVVANAGPDGVSLRREPGTGERIKVLPDGTALAFLGDERQLSGRAWKKVRDPAGSEGWIAAEFLAGTEATTGTDPSARSTDTPAVTSLTPASTATVTPSIPTMAPTPILATPIPTVTMERRTTATPAPAPPALTPQSGQPVGPLGIPLPFTTAVAPGPTATPVPASRTTPTPRGR